MHIIINQYHWLLEIFTCINRFLWIYMNFKSVVQIFIGLFVNFLYKHCAEINRHPVEKIIFSLLQRRVFAILYVFRSCTTSAFSMFGRNPRTQKTLYLFCIRKNEKCSRVWSLWIFMPFLLGYLAFTASAFRAINFKIIKCIINRIKNRIIYVIYIIWNE